MIGKILFCILIATCAFVYCDIPVHCEFPAVKGEWTFKLSAKNYDKSAPFNQCKFNEPLSVPVERVLTVSLQGPNVAINKQTGEQGTWTMVDDEGLEIYLEDSKFLAYYNFTKDSAGKWKSNCGLTTTGWYHSTGINVSTWGCWSGAKNDQTNTEFIYEAPVKQINLDATFKNDKSFIEKINNAQKSWVAGEYPQFEGMPMHKLMRMAGAGPFAKLKNQNKRKTKEFFATQFGVPRIEQDFPDNFDWRNQTTCGSVNCVSPVRNQASCGSCYIFSASAALEARVRIASKGKVSTVFAPQDEVSCSPYNQGCSGGEPLLASKYFEDFGIPAEECDPYQGKQTQCPGYKCASSRQFVNGYRYVGGYYGACTEQGMMKAIQENGPVTVGFMVYRDFFNYRGGVYHHVTNLDSVNSNDPDPHWEPANHGVVVIGWGTQQSDGQKYWIVKNSWGTGWGLQGYFLIRRGNDECDIESGATEDFPIFA